MVEYSKSDTDKFLKIYASIILSERGLDGGNWKANREWLEGDFWRPLMNVITHTIPIYRKNEFELAKENEVIFIKDSKLPLQQWLPISINWFYWNRKEHPVLCDLASAKLKIDCKNIFHVIETPECYTKVNEWLSASSGNAKDFIDELEAFLKNEPFTDWKEDRLRNFWSDKIAKLKIWWFGEQCYSTIELSAQLKNKKLDKIILYSPMSEIRDILLKIGLQVQNINLGCYKALNERIRKHFQSLLPYLSEHEDLITHLNPSFCTGAVLNKDDKKKTFTAFYDAIGTKDKDKRVFKLRELALLVIEGARLKLKSSVR